MFGSGFVIDKDALFDTSGSRCPPVDHLRQSRFYFDHPDNQVDKLQFKIVQQDQSGQTMVHIFGKGVDIHAPDADQLVIQGPWMVATNSYLGPDGTTKDKQFCQYLQQNQQHRHCQRITLSTQGWIKDSTTDNGLDREAVKFAQWLMRLEDRLFFFGVQHDPNLAFVPRLQGEIKYVQSKPDHQLLSDHDLFTLAVKRIHRQDQHQQVILDERARRYGCKARPLSSFNRPVMRTDSQPQPARAYLHVTSALFFRLRQFLPSSLRHDIIDKVPTLQAMFDQGYGYNHIPIIDGITGKEQPVSHKFDSDRLPIVAPLIRPRFIHGLTGEWGVSCRMERLLQFPHSMPKPQASDMAKIMTVDRQLVHDMYHEMADIFDHTKAKI